MRAHPLHGVSPGPDPPRELHVFVEIGRGSRNKYELDKATGLLRVDRLLHSSVHYPGDYGFIPRTLGQDGDPLDAVVIVTEPTFPGCLVDARPLGVFVMEDEMGMDEKILCVPKHDPLFREYSGLEHVPPHFLREVEHFFRVYKDLEEKKTNLHGWRGLDDAHRIVVEAIERYEPPENAALTNPPAPAAR